MFRPMPIDGPGQLAEVQEQGGRLLFHFDYLYHSLGLKCPYSGGRWLVASILICFCSPETAWPQKTEPVEVGILFETSDDTHDSTAAGVIVARSKDGTATEVRAPLEGADQTILKLGSGIPWTLAVEAEGFWAAPETIFPTSSSERVTMKLLPTGRLHGKLAVGRGEQMPQTVAIRFSSALQKPSSRQPASEELFGASLECPVNPVGAWQCQIPAGELDVRLRAQGFVSHFFWALRLPAGGSTELGSLTLVRGASILGRVEMADDTPFAPDLEVRLLPRMATTGVDPAILEQARARSQSAEVNERGFFHFAAVAPGGYVVEATQAGWAPAWLPVDVLENVESQLTRPLTLERPAILELHVSPAMDPHGNPWTVTMTNADNLPGGLHEHEIQANLGGEAVLQDLTPGRYDLTLSSASDAGSTSWLHQTVTIEGATPLWLELPLLAVEGKIRKGNEPLQAVVWLGGVFGAEKVRFASDEDGRFHGYLPHEGTWPVEVVGAVGHSKIRLEPLEIVPKPGYSSAEIEIRIPDTRVAGEVVDAAGEAQAGALVYALHLREDLIRGNRFNSIFTEPDGSFEFHGLLPGTLTLSAKTSEGASSWQAISLTERDEPGSVRLAIERNLEIQGTVRSPSGQVVPGTRLTAKVSGTDATVMPVVETASGADGSFFLNVPASATELALLVLPPGYAARMARVRVEVDRPLEILVDEVGGALALELPEDPEGIANQPFLEHQNVQVPLYWLGGWRESPERWALLKMEPGDYKVCQGVRCADGYLVPQGALMLDARTARP